MLTAIQTIGSESYFAESILGIFKIIRGFAGLRDLSPISVPHEQDGEER